MTEDVTQHWALDSPYITQIYKYMHINWACNLSLQMCSFSIIPSFFLSIVFLEKLCWELSWSSQQITPILRRRQNDQNFEAMNYITLPQKTTNTLFTQEEKPSAKTQNECILEFHLLVLDKCIITTEVRQDLWVLYRILWILPSLQSQVFTVTGPAESGTIPSSPSFYMAPSEQTASFLVWVCRAALNRPTRTTLSALLSVTLAPLLLQSQLFLQYRETAGVCLVLTPLTGNSRSSKLQQSKGHRCALPYLQH